MDRQRSRRAASLQRRIPIKSQRPEHNGSTSGHEEDVASFLHLFLQLQTHCLFRLHPVSPNWVDLRIGRPEHAFSSWAGGLRVGGRRPGRPMTAHTWAVNGRPMADERFSTRRGTLATDGCNRKRRSSSWPRPVPPSPTTVSGTPYACTTLATCSSRIRGDSPASIYGHRPYNPRVGAVLRMPTIDSDGGHVFDNNRR